MPEVIELEGSAAELLGGAALDDDAVSEAAQGEDNDDASSQVTIHEPPRQLSAEEKEERRGLGKLAVTGLCFPQSWPTSKQLALMLCRSKRSETWGKTWNFSWAADAAQKQ